MTKGIHVAAGDRLIDPFPLYRQEPGSFFIFFGARYINFLMRRVDIAQENQVVKFLAQLFDVFQEKVIELQFKFESFRARLSIRKIDVEKDKIFEIKANEAPFFVEFCFA